MADTLCGYPGRDEVLVSYLYADLDGAERSAFDTHLVLCARCRAEVAQLRDVRGQLKTWEPPVATGQLSVASGQWPAISDQRSAISDQPSALSRGSQSWWREIPAWAQVAAALLCLGVGAGVANLDIRYDQQGLTVRTGWSKAGVAPGQTTGVTPGQSTGVAQDFSSAGTDSAPWRADLTALERQLRTEFRSADAAAAPDGAMLVRAAQPAMSDAELLKRVRALVDESERKQQRELALHIGEMARDVTAQRQADLRKIDQSLGLIQSNTGVEVMKQRQLLNYLVRVSSQK